MFPHLSGFRVNVSLLQEAVNKELIAILDRCDGTKVSDIIYMFICVAIYLFCHYP